MNRQSKKADGNLADRLVKTQPGGGARRMHAHHEIEIRVHLPKESKGPEQILELLERQQVTTLTCNCVADNEGLVLLLTTPHPTELQQLLAAAGYRCAAHPVILVGPTAYQPGLAARLLTDLRQSGVEVRYSYLASIAPDKCFMVVETTDNARAVALIR